MASCVVAVCLIECLWSNGSRVLHMQWCTTVLYCRAAAATRTVPTQYAGGGKRIYKWKGRRGEPQLPMIITAISTNDIVMHR